MRSDGPGCHNRGLTEIVALQIVNVEVAQHLGICCVFNPFGHQLQAKGTGEVDHAFDKDLVVGVVGDINTKTAIEFDHGEGKLHEVAIGGVACAKIIQGHTATMVLQSRQEGMGGVEVAQLRGFSKFNDQSRCQFPGSRYHVDELHIPARVVGGCC